MEDEFLTCSICYDVFDEPKTLACLHRFCEKCLHAYLDKQKPSNLLRQRGFQCPVCREFMKAPDPRKPPEQWAKLLKTDFHLKNLIKFVESKPGLSTNASRVSAPQHPCQSHKDQETDLYCVDCSAIICHLCAGISHRTCSNVVTLAAAAARIKAMHQNNVEDLSRKLRDGADYEKAREKCLNQLEKQKLKAENDIKAFAQDMKKQITRSEEELLKQLSMEWEAFHKKITLNIVQYENKIATVKDHLQNAASSYKNSSDYDIVMGKHSLSTEQPKHNIDTKDYRAFLSKVSTVKITFNKVPNPQTRIGNLSFTYNTEDHQMPETCAEAKAPTLNENNQTKNLIDRFLGFRKKQTPQNQCVPSKTTDSSSSESQNKLLPTTMQVSEAPPKPVSRTLLPTVARETEANTSRLSVESDASSSDNETTAPVHSGGVRRTPSSFRERTSNIAATIASETGQRVFPQVVHPSKPANSKLSKMRSINAAFREDSSKPKLRDIIALEPSSTILATDWANQCVKAFYVRREKDTRLALGGKPWSITQMNATLAAVSLPYSQQICIIKIVPKLMVQNSFMSAKKYSGLATLNDSMLVASGGSGPPSVDIINLYGEILKSFSVDKDQEPLFEYPSYVCVTPAMMILVSDRIKGSLVCLTPIGNVKFCFQPEPPHQMNEPSGIVCNSSGKIVVVETRGLLALTPSGELEQVLVKPQDGLLKDPRGVTIDKEGLLYVTSDDEEIHVYGGLDL